MCYIAYIPLHFVLNDLDVLHFRSVPWWRHVVCIRYIRAGKWCGMLGKVALLLSLLQILSIFIIYITAVYVVRSLTSKYTPSSPVYLTSALSLTVTSPFPSRFLTPLLLSPLRHPFHFSLPFPPSTPSSFIISEFCRSADSGYNMLVGVHLTAYWVYIWHSYR